MKLKINGEIKTIEHTAAEFILEGLLEHLGYKPQLVVVELNGAIINSNDPFKKTEELFQFLT